MSISSKKEAAFRQRESSADLAPIRPILEEGQGPKKKRKLVDRINYNSGIKIFKEDKTLPKGFMRVHNNPRLILKIDQYEL